MEQLQEQHEVKLISMDMIQSQQVEWLWYPYIPFGKITIVQGDPGEGKTTFALNLAARISKGERFGQENTTGVPLSVIYQTAEDGLSDTVKPRLEEAKADCSRILVIDDREKSLTMDDDRLKKAMTKKLSQLAEHTGCAVLLIGHMNKASGVKAAYRGIGSIDFFAVARSVLLVARVAEQENIRVLAQIKNNLAEEGQPIAFERRKDEFRYMGAYDITVDELLGGYCKTNKIQQAKQLIKGLYGKNVLISSADMEQKAEAIGISKRTMDMAKKELNIKSKKQGSSWYWDLDKS